MTKKERLALMGKIVTVSEIIGITKISKNRVLYRQNLAEEKTGWVVGFSNICEGVIVRESYDDSGDCPAAYLDKIKSHPVILIKFWMTHAPVKVPIDTILKFGGEVKYPISTHDRELMKEDCKRVERDKRGRFI